MGYKVKRIMLGTKQVRPVPFTPGANTLAYYPLKGNINDYSGHGYNGTLRTGTLTYPNNDYASITNAHIRFPNGYSAGTTNNNFTISLWAKDFPAGGKMFVIGQDGVDSGGWGMQVIINNSGVVGYCVAGGTAYNTSGYSITSGVWHHMVLTTSPSSGEMKLYIDGVLKENKSISGNIRINGYSSIGGQNGSVSSTGNISEVINEKSIWTADEISKYYNLTKYNYGL